MLSIVENNYIYPKLKGNKYSSEEGGREIFKDEILKELNGGDDIIWIKNRPLISKKSPFWNGGGMVSQTDLDFFADNLHLIKNDCILISCYGARPIPSSLKTSSFEKIINCEKIKKWYTQNYDRTIIHEKLYPFPIGLPCVGKWYIKNNKEHTFNYILNVRDNIKKNEILCDVHLNPNSSTMRGSLRGKLNNCKHINKLNKRVNSVKDFYDLASTYKFIISVKGLGIDCHRTWEALLLGAIVITNHTPLDVLYTDLPVIIIDNWDELLDYNNLKKWENQVGHLTNKENILEKMKIKYWLNRVY